MWMNQSVAVREKIKHLRYDKEYDYSVFEGIANREAVKKTISRSPSLVRKTVNGKFYRVRIEKETDRFDPAEYTFNCFWQSNRQRKMEVTSIIRNYLSTMSKKDIETLCRKYGKLRVKSELVAKYKEMHARGYVETPGMTIPVTGRYDRNPAYRELLGLIDDC